MSTDPIRDYADWSGMTPEWESRIAHPAGKNLKSEQRMDNEAMRVGNKEPWWSRRPGLQFYGGCLVGGSIMALACAAPLAQDLVGGWPL